MNREDIKRIATFVSLLLLLSGCAVNTPQTKSQPLSLGKLTTAYDYQLLNQQYQAISLPQMIAAASTADVLFIGEYHGNQASHLLQTQLLAALHQRNQQKNRATVLSMEQFERNQQAILDDYLNKKIGEQYLIEKAPTWSNYKGSYRPLVEYAKQNKLPVVAANAPAKIIRCIGRQGDSYTAKLTPKEKQTIASKPFTDVPAYADKFFGVMGISGHAKAGAGMRRSYQAQLARDNTMAESIDKSLKQTPNAQVIHLNGSFHSAGHLGTVGALIRMNPSLKVVVITPVHQDQLDEFKKENKSTKDYYYLLNRQPKTYVNSENRKAAHKAMFATSAKKSCK